jgi:hypothetical protein
MDVVYQVNLDIDANASKDIRVKIAKVIQIFNYVFLIQLINIRSIARVTSSGCSSNPCTIGICYQLNQNGPSYVCICPDGILSLSCNSTSKFYF